jgi:hypothetical protein
MNPIDLEGAQIRRDHTDEHRLLSPDYIDFRDRVMRWRDKLEAAGFAIERERKAREQANEYIADARLMDEQLRITESQKGWKRSGVLG